MQRTVLAGHNNNRHLTSEEVENNIGGLPITDNRIQELFDSLDADHSGTVSVEAAKEFYRNLDHLGLQPSEAEVDQTVRKYANTSSESLTYDEFACLVLTIALW